MALEPMGSQTELGWTLGGDPLPRLGSWSLWSTDYFSKPDGQSTVHRPASGQVPDILLATAAGTATLIMSQWTLSIRLPLICSIERPPRINCTLSLNLGGPFLVHFSTLIDGTTRQRGHVCTSLFLLHGHEIQISKIAPWHRQVQ
jgi:hypothetical protein